MKIQKFTIKHRYIVYEYFTQDIYPNNLTFLL